MSVGSVIKIINWLMENALNKNIVLILIIKIKKDNKKEEINILLLYEL